MFAPRWQLQTKLNSFMPMAAALISLARHADVCASPWVWTMNKHAWVSVYLCSYGNSSNECALPQCNMLPVPWSTVLDTAMTSLSSTLVRRCACSFCKILPNLGQIYVYSITPNTHACVCMQSLTLTLGHVDNSKWSRRWQGANETNNLKAFFIE